MQRFYQHESEPFYSPIETAQEIAQQDNSASPALTAAQRARLPRERNRTLAFDSYCLSPFNLGQLSGISEPCFLPQPLLCFLTTPHCSPPQTHPQTHGKLTQLPSSAAD